MDDAIELDRIEPTHSPVIVSEAKQIQSRRSLRIASPERLSKGLRPSQ
jgi:hypothetical protein